MNVSEEKTDLWRIMYAVLDVFTIWAVIKCFMGDDKDGK